MLQIKDIDMKLLQIHMLEENYLAEFYCNKPNIASFSFNAQIQELLSDGSFGINVVTPYLEKLEYETELVIANCFEAQIQWARENNIILKNKEKWMIEVVCKQVESFKPDVIFLSDPAIFVPDFIEYLSYKEVLLIGWCGVPFSHNIVLDEFDVVLSNSTMLLQEATTCGARSVEMFIPGITEFISEEVKNEPKRWDVVFSGQWTGEHLTRNAYLNEIAKSQNESGRFSLGFFIDTQVSDSLTDIVLKYNRGARWGMTMYRALKNGRIVINAEEDSLKGELGNVKIFEVTCVGSFLLTEYYLGIEKYFEPGVEIETFENTKELIEKINYYIEHPEEREAIAKRGQERCLRDYSMKNKIIEFEGIITKYLTIGDKGAEATSVNTQFKYEDIKSDLEQFKIAAQKRRYKNYQLIFCGLTINCNDLLTFYIEAKRIFLNRKYEFETSNPSPKIIDCGGNIGLFTLFAKQQYPGAQITVFEPNSESFNLINRNLKANNMEDVEVINAGLYKFKGKVRRGLRNPDGNTTISEEKSAVIDVVKLDDYINCEIDLLRLNIKGAELKVISEMYHKLPFVKEMMIEYQDFNGVDQDLHRLLTILNDIGFSYLLHDIYVETKDDTKRPFHLNRDTQNCLLIYAKRLCPVSMQKNKGFGLKKEITGVAPVNKHFGFDQPISIDRYYIEKFLKENKRFIKGRVLEIGDSLYTQKFGSDVAHIDVLNSELFEFETIVNNLTTGENLPANGFDCIIITQTIQFVYDVKSAMSNVINALKPGGTLLISVLGISQMSHFGMDRSSEYWKFTDKSLKMLLSEFVDESNVCVQSYGNAKVAKAFLDGLTIHDVETEVLDYRDNDYQVVLTVRANKPFDKTPIDKTPIDETPIDDSPKRDDISKNLINDITKTSFVAKNTSELSSTIAEKNFTIVSKSSVNGPIVLHYNRVWDDPINAKLLSISPENFEEHLKILLENYNVIPLHHLLVAINCKEVKANAVSITFDDGYLDVLNNAVPILEKYGLHATVFVTSGMVGVDQEFWWDALERIFLTGALIPENLKIDWIENENLELELYTPQNSLKAFDEIYQILRLKPLEVINQTIDNLLQWAGIDSVGRLSHRIVNEEQLNRLASLHSIELGSHAVTHTSLALLSPELQANEIKESKLKLEKISNKQVKFFAYPFGTVADFTKETEQIVAENGYNAAVTTIQDNISWPVNMSAIPRRTVRNCSGESFREWLKSENKDRLESESVAMRDKRIVDYQLDVFAKVLG